MSETIHSTLEERRVFPPPAAFAAKAHIGTRAEYEKLYRESIDQPEQFFGRIAEEFQALVESYVRSHYVPLAAPAGADAHDMHVS